MKQVRSKVWNPTWVIEKKSIEQLNRKDDDGNGESVFFLQGQYMKMWDNIDQVYKKYIY